MKVEVTPSSPVGQKQPSYGSLSFKTGPDTSHKKRLLIIGLAVVIVLGLVGLVYHFVIQGPQYTTTSIIHTTSTTTIISGTSLSSCGIISKPGTYHLSKSISYSATKGACLNVTSNNVAISCNGSSITGSGPYTGIAPYSYGVYAKSVSNVSITGCKISGFSYGVYSSSAMNFSITGSNITTNYVADAYLGNTNGGTIKQNLILNSSSPQGSLIITNKTSNMNFINNTLKYNAVYGIYVNSSSNNFIKNYIVGSKFSFYCSALNGFAKSNSASGNTCYNQTGCSFVSCTGLNIPVNVSQITLHSQVSSCGSITSPGTYSLNNNLNMRNYTNASSSIFAAPCINIKSNSVTLQCNGHSITNAYTAVMMQQVTNVIIRNCNIYNSTTGIQMVNTNSSQVSGSSFSNDVSGIVLQGAFADTISNVNASGGQFGLYLGSVGSSIMQNFTSNRNKYGLYLSNSVGNIFSHGVAIGNSRFDVFGTPDSVGSSSNLMSGTTCNLTDTLWATCKQYIQNASFQSYPLTSCTTITRPGMYNLSQTIFSARPNCMQIMVSNVLLNCNNNPKQANPNTTLSAIVIIGLQNVTVNKCNLINYQTGVMVNSSSRVAIDNTTITQVQSYGIQFNNVRNSTLVNDSVQGAENVSILLNNVKKSTIFNNNAHGSDSVISVFNSSQNQILNNSGYANDYGMIIAGLSTNNTVSNNQYSQSGQWDYFCGPGNQGLGAEKGGINIGVNDSNCRWMANIPYIGSSLDCPVITTPGLIQLQSDAVYSSGATCFSVLSNLTTINCQGYTVLATNGGTFAYFKNSTQASILKNCLLKGFSTPITGQNSSIQLINDTIYDNFTNTNPTKSEINLTRGQQFIMTQSNITTQYTGVRLYNYSFGTIKNDNLTASTAFSFFRTTAMIISNVWTRPKTGVGFYLSNSTLFSFQNNNITAVTAGLLCTGWSKASTNNTDSGGNMCSSSVGCAWMGKSSTACH